MMDRRAQVDKIFTTFPVMLLVFLLMGIFVFAAFGLKGLYHVTAPTSDFSIIGTNYLLVQKIGLVKGDLKTKMPFFEALVRLERQELTREDILNSVVTLTKQEQTCAFLAKGHSDHTKITRKTYLYDDYSWFVKKGEIIALGYNPDTIVFYRKEFLLSLLDYELDGKDISLISYYGGCIS